MFSIFDLMSYISSKNKKLTFLFDQKYQMKLEKIGKK